MIYQAKVKRKLRYARVYRITKRLGHRENLITRLLVRLVTKKEEV